MSDAGRVLVVDDSQSVRRAIGRMLAPIGLSVDAASDGDEARERLARERPRLVICDVVLPGADGYEVCRFVRSRPQLAGVPVLLISGLSSPEVTRRAEAAGAVGVMAKPFTAKSLVARVEQVLGAAEAAALGEDGPPAVDLVDGLGELPGVRAAYLLEPETGGARRLIGETPVPAALLALVLRVGQLAGELGLGDPQVLSAEGDAGTVVVRRLGGAAIAVCFDRDVLPGQARHRVRRLRSPTEPPTSLSQGARIGNRPG